MLNVIMLAIYNFVITCPYRDTFTRKVQEQENLGKNLRERQKYVRENQGQDLKQMKMWKVRICINGPYQLVKHEQIKNTINITNMTCK